MAKGKSTPSFKSLPDQVRDLLARVDDLERGQNADRADSAFPNMDPPVAHLQEIIMGGFPQPDVLPDFAVVPFEIEHGKPTGNVTTDVATVTLQPCDAAGTSYASASTAKLYVANDRQIQHTANRGWTTATILSFVRFTPWVAGSPNIVGILIGEARTDIIQPGDVIIRPGTVIRTGFLPCDGAAVSRTTYAALFAAIAELWGVGDGSTTFNVPDFDGKALRGFGTSPFNTVGATGGIEKHDLEHQHEPNPSYEMSPYTGTGTYFWTGSRSGYPIWTGTSNPPAMETPNGSHEVDNRGPWASVKFMIKT